MGEAIGFAQRRNAHEPDDAGRTGGAVLDGRLLYFFARNDVLVAFSTNSMKPLESVKVQDLSRQKQDRTLRSGGIVRGEVRADARTSHLPRRQRTADLGWLRAVGRGAVAMAISIPLVFVGTFMGHGDSPRIMAFMAMGGGEAGI